MLGFLKRQIAQSASAELIAPACASAAVEIGAIKQAFIQRNCLEDSNLDPKLRLATDDFLAGFALGLAFRYLFGRGVQTPSNSKYALLPTLQELLRPHFPDIDILARHESGTVPMNMGIFFGLQEHPGKRRALRLVWECVNPHKLAPETTLMQYAFEDGADFEFGHMAKTTILEIQRRYALLA